MINKIIYLFVLSLLLIPFAAAPGDMDMGLSVDNSASVSYAGDQTTASGSVSNTNWLCSIRCSYTTSQGESGTIGEISAGKSKSFSYVVRAEGTSPTPVKVTVSCSGVGSLCGFSGSEIGYTNVYFGYCGDGTKQASENCGNCYSDAPCPSSYHCESSACVRDAYCGDQKKNQVSEQCDGSDLGSKDCKSLGYDYGIIRCNPQCSFDTSGCGRCTNDCNPPQKECAGNGYKVCETDINGCHRWSSVRSCSTDETCSAGSCVNINNDLNCGAIGNRCDSTEKLSSSGKKYCSSDYTKAIEILKVTTEKCINKQCTPQSVEKNREVDCKIKNTYCQDGACGCSEGYEVCESLKGCIKKKDTKLNQPCGCDFQCEKGFCDSSLRQCVGGLNLQLSSEKSTLSIGEETTISLSVSNPLNRDVDADIILNLGSGVELVEVLSGDQCSGSQCKLDKTKIPEGSKKDVTVRVKAKSDVNSLMTATVTYGLEGRKEPIEISEKNTIKIIECGNGKIDEGETSETCCIDASCPADNQFYSFTCNKKTKSCDKSLHSYYIYGGIGILIFVFLIIFGITLAIKHHKKSSSKKDKKKEHEKVTEKKEQEEALEEKHSSNESITKQIEHLHSLMEKGILTEREFKKKKKKLLKKLK